MVLTEDDMAGIAAMVAQTVQQLLAAQPPVQPQQPPVQLMPDHQRRSTVDEKHYRKLVVFGGEHWKDWSFQFRSSTRASSGEAYDILNWAEKETTEISDFAMMDNLIDEDVAERLSGELFNVISTTVKGNHCSCCTTVTSMVQKLGGGYPRDTLQVPL